MFQVITATTFSAEVLAKSYQRPMVLYFWASWCASCRLMGPILECMADKAAGGWLLCKVSTEAEPTLTQTCEVHSLPAVQLYMHGKMVAEVVDLLSETKLTTWLEESIAVAVRHANMAAP